VNPEIGIKVQLDWAEGEDKRREEDNKEENELSR
jgi:hypothetical protein